MEPKRYHLPFLEDVRTKRHVCFAEQLRSANRTITKLYTEHLGDSDIGIAQLSLLIRLYYFGEITLSRLAQNLETDRTTLTRNVQLLERSGHLEIVPGQDLRHRMIRLTDQGFASLEIAIPRWLKAQDDLHRRLGDQAWGDLFLGMRLLAKLDREPCTEAPSRGPRKRTASKPR